MSQLKKLQEMKITLEAMAESEHQAPDCNNNLLAELDKSIAHIRRAMIEITKEK